MYCFHCGKEIDDNSNYCKWCGTNQYQSKENNTSKNKVFVFPESITLADEIRIMNRWIIDEKAKITSIKYNPSKIRSFIMIEAGFSRIELEYVTDTSENLNQFITFQESQNALRRNADQKVYAYFETYKKNNPNVSVLWDGYSAVSRDGAKWVTIIALIKKK